MIVDSRATIGSPFLRADATSAENLNVEKLRRYDAQRRSIPELVDAVHRVYSIYGCPAQLVRASNARGFWLVMLLGWRSFRLLLANRSFVELVTLR